MTRVITADQWTWFHSTERTAQERAAWLSVGECDALALANIKTFATSYAPTINGVVVGEERYAEHALAVQHAQRSALAMKKQAAETAIPAWTYDCALSESFDRQADLRYTVDGVFDLRSAYLEYDDHTRAVEHSTLLDLVVDWTNGDRDPSVESLLAALPDNFDASNDGSASDEELHYTILEHWQKTGFYGYLVLVSMPVREYRIGITDSYSFSSGYRSQGWVYVTNLEDRAPLERWATARIAEYLAAAS